MKDYLYEAKQIINRYCFYEFDADEDDEYDETVEYADFDDLSKIPLAYTTDEDEDENGMPIKYQVEVDLINFEFRYYCNDELVNIEHYNSIKELIESIGDTFEDGDTNWLFNELIYRCRKDG